MSGHFYSQNNLSNSHITQELAILIRQQVSDRQEQMEPQSQTDRLQSQ